MIKDEYIDNFTVYIIHQVQQSIYLKYSLSLEPMQFFSVHQLLTFLSSSPAFAAIGDVGATALRFASATKRNS